MFTVTVIYDTMMETIQDNP